jgi:hypothetical protein
MKKHITAQLFKINSNSSDLFFKLYFLNKLKLKNNKNTQIQKFEENILNMNSFFQNDVFSGTIYLLNFKKFFLNKERNILKSYTQNNTLIFCLFLQKTITGNSFRINSFIFNHFFKRKVRQILILEFLKIYNSYEFFFNFNDRFFASLPFFISFIKEKNKKKCIYLILNKIFFKYCETKKIETYSTYKFNPFVSNCHFFTMEFLGIKVLFFYQSVTEHFAFKLKSVLIKKDFVFLFSHYGLEFKEFFFEFFNFLQILQSIETSPANCQMHYSQTLFTYKTVFFLKKNLHSLLLSLLKKNKANFFS